VREKQLDYTNIYQRQIVLKEKGPVPPNSPPTMAALPAPKRTKPKGKNNTNANQTKEYKAKETKNNAGGKDSDDESSKKPNSVFLTAQSDKDSASDRDINKNKQANDLLSITDGKNNNGSTGNMVNGNNGVSEDELNSSEKRRREEFERNLREEDERLKKEKGGVERRLKEIQEREEREKTEREAKWREDSARRAREAEERQLASARRREEERRKEEERIAEDRKREDDRKREEERREKEKKAFQKDDSFFEDEESRRKKDALLARYSIYLFIYFSIYGETTETTRVGTRQCVLVHNMLECSIRYRATVAFFRVAMTAACSLFTLRTSSISYTNKKKGCFTSSKKIITYYRLPRVE
jgi:hypothetical protein